MRLTHWQINKLNDKSKGYPKDTKFHLDRVSKCAYSDAGGYNQVYDTVFFTVINVEYEVFPDGSVTARNWRTGEEIE